MATNTIIKTVGEAPINGNQYVRQDAEWQLITVDAGIADAPDTGLSYVRNSEAWEIPALLMGARTTNTFYLGIADTNLAESLPMATTSLAGIMPAADKVSIDANTSHRMTATGNPHNVLATQITDFDTEVSNNASVVANTAKVSFPEAPLGGDVYARQSGGWVGISTEPVNTQNQIFTAGNSTTGSNINTFLDTIQSDLGGYTLTLRIFTGANPSITETIDFSRFKNGKIIIDSMSGNPSGNSFQLTGNYISLFNLPGDIITEVKNITLIHNASTSYYPLITSEKGLGKIEFKNCVLALSSGTGDGASVLKSNLPAYFYECEFFASTSSTDQTILDITDLNTFNLFSFIDCPSPSSSSNNFEYLIDGNLSTSARIEVLGNAGFYNSAVKAGASDNVKVTILL